MKVPWSKPDIGIEEREAVNRVIDSGWLSQGLETEKFERELAAYIGCSHVVAVNNGTSALLCAILAHGYRQLIIPTYTFPATWNVPITLGITPQFQKVDTETFLMQPPENSDKPCMPVSIAGLPLNPEDWIEHTLIEDGCEAFGGQVFGSKVGGEGWTTCFSFHAAKLITTIEGGAIATDSDRVAYDCRLIRSHGESLTRKYRFLRSGLNLRTTDIASAIGRVQLRKLPEYLGNRQRIADYYRENLQNHVNFQQIPDYAPIHANMFFPILVEHPDGLAAALGKRGIETRRPWPPFTEFEDALEIYRRILAIPIYNTMTMQEAEYVVEHVKVGVEE